MSEINTEEEIKNLLYERMMQEYDRFLESTMNQLPAEILKASYEKVIKEDILVIVESGELSAEHMRALLRMQHPLEECYQSWLDEDVSYMEDLRICIEKTAHTLL